MKKILLILVFAAAPVFAGEPAHFAHASGIACDNPPHLAQVLESSNPELVVRQNPLLCRGAYNCRGCVVLDQIVYILPIESPDNFHPEVFPAGGPTPMYMVVTGLQMTTGLTLRRLFISAEDVGSLRKVNVKNDAHATKILYGYAQMPSK